MQSYKKIGKYAIFRVIFVFKLKKMGIFCFKVEFYPLSPFNYPTSINYQLSIFLDKNIKNNFQVL